MEPKYIGNGEFGPIYEGLRGHDAILFLLELKTREVQKAMERLDIGAIDFVYGKTGKEGYGLAHIHECHPEIINYIVRIIKEGKIFKQADDRILILDKIPVGKGVAVLRLDWNGLRKQWLVTAF